MTNCIVLQLWADIHAIQAVMNCKILVAAAVCALLATMVSDAAPTGLSSYGLDCCNLHGKALRVTQPFSSIVAGRMMMPPPAPAKAAAAAPPRGIAAAAAAPSHIADPSASGTGAAALEVPAQAPAAEPAAGPISAAALADAPATRYGFGFTSAAGAGPGWNVEI